MPFNSVLEQHFSRLLRSLNAEGIPYLIVGGFAVILHGYIRATDDLDIWVEPDERYALALNKALRAVNIRLPVTELMRMLREACGIRLGTEHEQIDLLFQIAGVDFAACYSRRVVVEVDAIPLTFIGLDDLRASKQAAGRLQDLLDLENLPGG